MIRWLFGFLIFGSGLLAACGTAPVTPTPTATPDPVMQGREVFLRVCAECHGQNGEGYANELSAPALDASEHAWHHPDQQIRDWIANGKLGVGSEMPALGDQLTKAEIEAVIAYLHTLWTPEQLEAQQDITNRYGPQEGDGDGS
jgi:mono/diheme cytochrome c family protein